MENTYTITLYCFDHSTSGIFTTTQLLEEAGKLKGTEPFTDVDAAKKLSQNILIFRLGVCDD